jgi:hypothetical protein
MVLLAPQLRPRRALHTKLHAPERGFCAVDVHLGVLEPPLPLTQHVTGSQPLHCPVGRFSQPCCAVFVLKVEYITPGHLSHISHAVTASFGMEIWYTCQEARKQFNQVQLPID